MQSRKILFYVAMCINTTDIGGFWDVSQILSDNVEKQMGIGLPGSRTVGFPVVMEKFLALRDSRHWLTQRP